ncbi:hypothetical protein CASFOL_041509 [Castilleja foliolosa]|uniref:Uncharacterized protein n=1 Tax=Castilleja foliolosa TaxID=1961234 RepID=A0ABD3BBV1_9LAMI
MLSTSNPPPDPSSDEISQLKSGNFISNDEKASNYLEVDLLKSGLDDISQTLPNFSIRGYVYKTRSKDIKTHWPFSSKKLQLCLKHGIKDVLPPFETLESVRNPYSDCLLPVSSKNASQKMLALDPDNYKSSSPQKDKEYYPSDVNSVPSRVKSPTMKPEITVRAANKVRNSISTQNPAKKCRLIVKVGNKNISEDLSDSMASKVCPVCMTFTSSSNTTLNAHIDQCLSGESTSVKWTVSPKVIKHRIKPRKTRLMVDIYETAIPCTLEDLDIRNGTNWASNFGFNKNNNNDNENHFMSNAEDKKEEEGAVYIDSNGTKVRILSRLSDVKFNLNGEEGECGPRKLVKRDKERKIVPSKNTKLLKRQPYEQRRCSPRLDSCPKINNAPEMKSSNKETEKDDIAQPLKACDRPMKSINNDSGTIKSWMSSKRTGHKNPDHKSDHHPKITNNSRITTCPSSLLDNNPLSATETDRTSNESESDTSFSSDDEYMPEQQQQQQEPCPTNRACFYFSDSLDDDDNNKNNRKMLSDTNFKRLKENRSTVNVHRRPFISSRGKKLSTLTTNNPLFIRRESFPESKCLRSRKRLPGFKKPAIHMQNNHTVEKQNAIAETQMEKESRVLKIRKKRCGLLNNATSSTESDNHVFDQNKIDSLTGHVMSAGTSSSAKADEIFDEFVREEEQPLAAFCDDFTTEVNVNKDEGNYVVNADSIPITGPPGSFLPSPGRMGLDELQGNSSLTSCRLHSSGDERELIIDRMDSSDSLISGTSFKSNSIAARPDPLLTFQAFGPHVYSETNELRAKSIFPESLSPLTPKTVFRLMGKDLMVVNKEENPSTQCGPAGFVSMTNGFPDRPLHTDDAINFSRGPFVFDDAKTPMPFDFASNFRTLPQLPAPNHQPRGFGLSYSLDYCPSYAGGPAFTPHSSNYDGKLKEIDESTFGFKHVNPFFDYQTRCNYPHGPIPNRNSVVWNRDLHGGPTLQRRDPLNAPSQSTGHHERSSFYFSNGFHLPSNFS